MFPVSLSRNFLKVSSHFRSICRCRGKMVGQQTLTSYFSPGADRKRRSACQEIDDNNNIQQNEETVTAPSKKKKVSLDIGERLSGSIKFTKINSSDDVTNNNQENVPESATSRNKSSENQCRLSATMMQVCADTNGLVKNMGPSWFKALQPQFSKDYFIQLSKFVSDERGRNTIFPPSHQVFSWTRTCDVSEVKVVILGQDPYHNVNQAHGFAFSVQKGVTPPPSLVNMYKELEDDVTGFQRPGHGDLTGWARQGVLLLNAVLTVRAHNANSHKDKGWEKFTDAVIAYISSHVDNVVFILWGAYAQKKGAQIKTKKHLILKGPHPSPLSAHRGFFGCQHFSKANDYLKQHGKVPVNWSDL